MCIHYQILAQIIFLLLNLKIWQNLQGIFLTPFPSIDPIKINGCFVSNGNIYIKKADDVEAEILVETMNDRGHNYNNCRMRNLTGA